MLRASILAVGLAAGVTAASLATPASAETRLTYGTWAPDSYPNSTAVRAYFDRVSQALGGGLAVDYHFGGSVVNIRTTLPAVRDRLVDVAYVTGSLFINQFPVDYIFTELASLDGDTRAITPAVSEVMLLDCPECLQEVQRNRVVTLGYVADAPFYLMCRQPVADLASLRGRQIRGVGPFALLAQSVGATPVNTAPGEVFEAMERGVVGCAIGGGFWLRAYSLWDVARTVVDYRLGQYNNGTIATFNRDAWQELSPRERQALLDNLPFLLRSAAYAQYRDDAAARQGSVQRGVQWVPPGRDFVDHVEAFRRSELTRVVEAAVQRRVDRAVAERLVRATQAALAKWTRILSEIGDDEQQYEDAIRREIYSRFRPAT